MKKDNGVLTGVTEEDLNLLKENSELFWSGVTKIGKFAFSGRINLRSIIIPDCVQMIDEYAFSYCNNLKRIEIPDSVTKIGPYSFRCCTSLEHIHIPDSMKEIGEGAFCSCENLESIVIPSGVKEIESHTFLDCENLESVSLSNGVVTIGERAFNGCVVLDNIVLPDSVKEIEYSAFADCISLENIHISKGATKIDNQSFSSCRSLKNVVIPDGVTEIGDRAFDCCSSLESLVIPKSVTKIGANVFHCCQDLKEITLGCEDGDRTLKVNQNVLESLGTYFSEIKNFVIERDKQKKSFIPAFQIIVNTPKDMVENFYKYSKNWGEFLGNFAKSVGKSPKDVLDEPKADFYKLCLVSGVFSKEQKEREEAKKFIEQNIIGKFGESELHERFAGLQTRENGFNPEYAKFLRINYKENFMIRYLYGLSKNLFAASYNRFSEIQKAYPNREVVTNTDNDRITPKIVENFLLDNKYENVTKETEELAELCGNYGYSQQQFEEVSKWFLKGKKVKAEGKQQLCCKPDQETRQNIVTYEFLEKDNPLGAVLGDITNCCQAVDDAGETCCRHGMTKPKGGFVVFKKNGKIVGQSWVWFNEEMGKVCLDNVEVPRSAKSSVAKRDAGFIECLSRLKGGFVEGMKEKGLEVSHVTLGEGYNDIMDIARNAFVPAKDKVSAAISAAAVQSSCQKMRVQGGAPIGVYTDTIVGERLID